MAITPRETIPLERFQQAHEQFQALPGLDVYQLAFEDRWREVPASGYCFLIQAIPGHYEAVIDMMQYGVYGNDGLPLGRHAAYGGSAEVEVRLMKAHANTLLITEQPPTDIWDGVRSYTMLTTNFFFVDEHKAQLTPLGDGLQCVTQGAIGHGIYEKLLRLLPDATRTGLFSAARIVGSHDEARALLEAAGQALQLTDQQYAAFVACMDEQLTVLEEGPARFRQALGDAATA